jgi:hypothetical protein
MKLPQKILSENIYSSRRNRDQSISGDRLKPAAQNLIRGGENAQSRGRLKMRLARSKVWLPAVHGNVRRAGNVDVGPELWIVCLLGAHPTVLDLSHGPDVPI